MKKAFDTTDTMEIDLENQGLGMKVVCGMWTIETKLIDGIFPPYDQVIPKNFDFEVELNTGTLLESINVLMSDRNVGTIITVNGVFSLQTDNPAVGMIETIIDPENNTHEGEDFRLGLRLLYLKEAINPKTETTKMRFQSPLDPMLIENDNGEQSVVMPMRI